MSDWYPAPLPDLSGRRFLVTGANSGVGFFTSARLVGAGAHVVMTGRSAERLDRAAGAIRERVAAGARSGAGEAAGTVETLVIDQSSFASVEAGAVALVGAGRAEPFNRVPAFDGLVLNAGMVHPPRSREQSADGHELVLATNVLGHFALVGRLLPHLAPGARVVWLGSMASRLSTFRVDDLDLEHGYSGWRAYAQSKIAASSLGFELDRRLRAADTPAASVVAHPGYSITGRTPRVPGVIEPTRADRFADSLQAPFTQGKHRGAEPVLHALVAPRVQGGEFWGPKYFVKGEPSRQRPPRVTTDPAIAARVWAFAEQATGAAVEVPA